MNKAEMPETNWHSPLPARLRPWITAAIQRRATTPPARYRIFPNMNCEIFINLSEHFTNARCGDPLRALPLASVFGPRTGAYDHAAAARSDWFLLQLTPLGVRDLLGCPLSALVGADHDLDVVAPRAAVLGETIAATRDFAARLRIVEDWAAACLDRAIAGNRTRALSDLHTLMLARRSISLGAMAEHLGISARQFRTLARDEFGMTPGALIGHARIAHGWETLYRTGSISEASALFADQAHFTREFRRYLGLTPGAYRQLKQGGDAISNGVDCAAAARMGIALA